MSAALRLVADDLSGALDALVHFVGLEGWPATPAVRWNEPGEAPAFCSDSRDATEARAVRTMRARAPWLLAAERSLLKCDSRLRGHVAAEIAACLEVGAPDRVVVAPALPAQGRVMRQGRLYTLARGRGRERGRDTAEPAATLEPVDLVRELGDRGVAVARRLPGESVPGGASLWDSATDADLDRLVADAAALGGKTLWCGSSGLAAALARRLGAGRPGPPGPCPIVSPVLAVIATRHATTLAQVQHLAGRRPGAVVPLRLDEVALRATDAALGRGESRCVSITIPDGLGPGDAERAVGDVLAGIAARVRPPGTCLVSGGATLRALADRLGVDAIRVDGELAPGVPVCRPLGGRWTEVRIVSKSGGFGDVDLLERVFSLAS